MTPTEKADKEMEVIAWMNKKGYDRRASKEVAPIIVTYLEEVVKNISSKQDVMRSACEHNFVSSVAYKGARVCSKCGMYK